MAGETLVSIRNRIRVHLREHDGRRASYGVVDIDNAIADVYMKYGSIIQPPERNMPAAFTIAAGADTFALPSTAAAPFASGQPQYAGEVVLQLVSDGSFMTKRTREELDSLRSGLQTYSTRPTDFTLWEDENQVVQGRCWPKSNAAESVNLFCTLVPEDLRHADDMDVAVLQFSRVAASAITLEVAAQLGAKLPPEELALRRIDKAIFPIWMADARRMLHREEVRRHNTKAVGRVMRWVS